MLVASEPVQVGGLGKDEPVAGVLDRLIVGVIVAIGNARGGTVHVGAWLSDHRSIWLAFSCCRSLWKYGQSQVDVALRKPLIPQANVARTCAMPINPIMSRGETTMVSDFDLVNPTVMRPKQSSVSSVGDPSA